MCVCNTRKQIQGGQIQIFKTIQGKTLKGTVHRYWSRAITHYFTGSEIIMEPKVCMILWYLRKDGA